MVAQVLAEQDQKLEVLEWQVLAKLKAYKKPIKTKHLARRFDIDRPLLVQVLNRLKDRGLVCWHIPKKLDDNQYYGWLIV